MNWCYTVEQCESACKALWGLQATRGERKAADIFHFLLFSSPAVPQPVSWLAPQRPRVFRGAPEDVPQIPQTSSALFHKVPLLLLFPLCSCNRLGAGKGTRQPEPKQRISVFIDRNVHVYLHTEQGGEIQSTAVTASWELVQS